VVGEGKAVFLTDFRYVEKAERDVRGFEIRRMAQNGTDEIRAVFAELGCRRIGFEGAIAYNQVDKLKRCAGSRRRVVEAGSIPSALRAVKDAGEISAIAASQRVNESVFRKGLAGAKAGMTELTLRRLIRDEMNRVHVDEAFETIVASGPNSSLPHAVPSSRKVRAGDYLLIDMGVRREGYHSDMTRTVCCGKPSPRHREIYRIVLDAQQRALTRIRHGVSCRDVDAAAREYIASAGYGDHFGHGLGHGVGLQIHEAPSMNPSSKEVLQEGMVVTVEPGIYVPGFGGVRIEDLVVVTRTGYRNLTSTTKRFTTLGE
jgi:Xaa-Pro aminopeptidase